MYTIKRQQINNLEVLVMNENNLRIIRLYLVLLFVTNLECQITTDDLLPHKTTITGIILNDIRKAFKTVINQTSLLNQIIPQMYGSTINKTTKCIFQFEIPKSNDNISSYSTWKIRRNDFDDPIFPNLTFEYMRMRVNKTRLSWLGGSNANSSDNTGDGSKKGDDDNTDGMQSYNVANTWNNLGLHGWEGAVAVLDHAESGGDIGNNTYPYSDILLELDGDETGESIARQDGENIYIARVNNPFGVSVKWELRNSTTRLKRDVLTLYSMIECSTGCPPLIYKGYGCYCGFSGAGVPVDGIDRCCKLHDKCYGNSNCISFLEYFVPYVWKCYRRKPLCAIDHGEFGGPDSCAARLCQCDVQLSLCLRRFTCPKRKAICYTSKARRLQNLLFTI